jgi:hypothetical protein
LKRMSFILKAISCIRNCMLQILAAWVVYCHWLLAQALFLDESWFCNSDTINQHNIHYWSVDNPHWAQQTAFWVQWAVNAWSGIFWDHMIGRLFLRVILKGHQDLQFVHDDLPVSLEEIPLWTWLFMWYQHDRDLLHHLVNVGNHQNDACLRRWIGRCRSIQ